MSEAASPDGIPPVEAPEFIREELPNGMTLLVAEHHEQPVVFYHALVRTGRLHDPEGREGTANILADMLQEGTENYDSSELAKAMDSLGGRFGASAGREGTWLNAQVLSRNGEKALELLAEMVMRPTFPKSALQRVKQQHRSVIRASYSDPDFIATQHLYAMIYGKGLAAGRLVTEGSIGGISREAVTAVYHRYFHASNTVLAVIGDCDPTEMMARLKDRFGAWEGGEATQPFVLPDSFQYRPGRRFVAKRKLSQATIVLGGRGAPECSELDDPFGLANHILGASGFSSRLMSAVRSDKGKTYGVSSSNSATRNAGTFTVRTFTRSDNTSEMVALIREVLGKALKEGLTEDELTKAKQARIGQFPLRFENPGSWADSAVIDLFYGRPPDYTARERERIAEITLEQVNEAMRKVLDLDKMSLVIVGDPGELEAQLRELGDFDTRREKGDWY